MNVRPVFAALTAAATTLSGHGHGRGRAPLACAAFALLASSLMGCGSDSTLTLPQHIEVTIEGQPGKTDWEFSPDLSGGQLSQQATVRIRNTGEEDLVISAVDFISQNEFIKASWPGGKPSMPLTLTAGKIQSIDIQYKPDPNIPDDGIAAMVIKHNDQDKAEIKLEFSVRKQGAVINLQQTSLTFLNQSKAAPQPQCAYFGNKGNAPLVFKKAYLATATPYYKITETPNEGDSIAALGEAGNPKDKPTTLRVCVNLTPEALDADYNSKIILETNDTSNPKATVVLSAKWETDNKYQVTCNSADGKIKYDFTGVTSGSTERCCTVYNEGPSPFLVLDVEVKALDAAKQAIADDTYSTTLYVLDEFGDDKVVTPKRSFSAAKSMKFCVAYQYPVDGKTTSAEAIIRFQQAKIPDTVQIPVIAGTCDTPDVVYGPGNIGLWMDAAVGAKATREIILANQSCAPMQIIQVCTAQVPGGTAQSPCSNANLQSTHFKLDKEIGLSTVEPWALTAIKVNFEPPDNAYTEIEHYLHVIYCGGKWDGVKCSEPPVSSVLNLNGRVNNVDDKPVLPTLKLVTPETEAAKAGVPYKIEAAVTVGDWPIGEYGAYLWFVAARPAGSTFWISTDFQSSNEPWINIKPDAPGKYRIIGAVQVIEEQADPKKAARIAWSPQASIEVEVK